MTGLTLYDKLWNEHLVQLEENGEAILYVDRHYIHEVTSPQAFVGLAEGGSGVRRPELTFAVADHNIPTTGQAAGLAGIVDSESRVQLEKLRENVERHRVPGFGIGDPANGIAHVVGPERGLTQPGMLVLCGDSHTSTHGALGALAFGIGTSEVEHVLATQTLRGRKAANFEVRVEGPLAPCVSAKDLALAIIARLGTSGAAGAVVEYRGPGVRALSMEARMTVCNMTIECGGRAGLVAPDEVTFAYLRGRPAAPAGDAFDRAMAWWRTLPSDPDAVFDRSVTIHAGDVTPMLTWGTTPAQAIGIDQSIPHTADVADPVQRLGAERALGYMGLVGGDAIAGTPIDVAFIGSCTNGRIEDLRAAAAILAGRRVAGHVRLLVVPGSGAVRRQAEMEGLDHIFRAAGADWREPGCSMCIGLNADRLKPGERCAATSNRNFEGRQGSGGRTHLMSPAMVAAAAVAGCLVDVREYAR